MRTGDPNPRVFTQDDLERYGYIYGAESEDDAEVYRRHLEPAYRTLGLNKASEAAIIYGHVLDWKDTDGQDYEVFHIAGPSDDSDTDYFKRREQQVTSRILSTAPEAT